MQVLSWLPRNDGPPQESEVEEFNAYGKLQSFLLVIILLVKLMYLFVYGNCVW